ncbi:hypothetical protein ALQ74_200103 [Pseudomonas savastanoi pv. glycinea]|uniref:Lipoprotein n=1 Tax=Pseudomonas savastanoi pv. glycinea TaxID=318 RepID=A0A3M3FJK8_PSESG|nr:hypothetical protein [Pseudomonas savastanoi pv. phaseolicola]RMM61596.1 hypothetical protein ALQ74_200103 [Pseudomonas savastanoi pv. glycinea]RMQ61832.1 hypothetical protein ALQ02_200067 [Pseudomonas savastanoi pv. phaseolicola]
MIIVYRATNKLFLSILLTLYSVTCMANSVGGDSGHKQKYIFKSHYSKKFSNGSNHLER